MVDCRTIRPVSADPAPGAGGGLEPPPLSNRGLIGRRRSRPILVPAPARPPRSQAAALMGAVLTTSMANLAQTTVLGLLVYDLTRSELDLGFLGLAEFAPAALLVLVAGAPWTASNGDASPP